MRIVTVLALLLLASAFSLSVGGFFLYIDKLVPPILIETTLAAVIILFAISYFVARGNMIAVNISSALGVIAPIISYSTPAHVSVLEQIRSGGLIGFLGVLQLLGFYVFPIAFVILRIAYHGKIKSRPPPHLNSANSVSEAKKV